MMKISAIIVCDSPQHLLRTARFYEGLLQGITEFFILENDYALIETATHSIRLFLKNHPFRGHKADYLFNLTQDPEFHSSINMPITCNAEFDEAGRIKRRT